MSESEILVEDSRLSEFLPLILKQHEFTEAGVETIEGFVFNQNAYRITFTFDKIVVSIRILFNDDSGSDVVITNTTVLPAEYTCMGHGSRAIGYLIAWAKECPIKEIRASQILPNNESFWKKNGFKRDPSHAHTNDFIYQLL